jgi:hypothetical protein
MRYVLLIVAMSVAVTISSPPEIIGCAAVPRGPSSVGVNSEEAIIVYDAASRTEHFIRRADFRTEEKDFGFLVPTPSKPDLGEADSRVFDTLQQATAARYVPSGNVKRFVSKRGMEVGSRAPQAPVILDRKKVAGYDAVVLLADDVDGLKKWLEDNKYNARPAVMDWLKWYVEHKWIITAFKVALDANAARDRWSKSVRMSFEASAPFYPYREPEDMRTPIADKALTPARKLRVYLLFDARFEGTLGSDGKWAGRTVWSNICPKNTLTRIVDGLGFSSAKENESLNTRSWHLTEFEDDSSPRPGTDEVYFRRSADQSTLERPVIPYDQYEYVFEDDDPQASKKSKRANDNNDLAMLGLIPGVASTILVVVVIAFLAYRSKQRTK